MKLQFEKYSAHGNDFIIIDNRKYKLPLKNEALFQKICTRRLSVGADGVILIDTEEPDFRAHFYNSDGKATSMCGNGSRAIVDYAHNTGIVVSRGTFWVWGKKHHFAIEGNSIGGEIHIESPIIKPQTLHFDTDIYNGYICNTGVPHLVFITSGDIPEATIDFARKVRYAPIFSTEGINVNWVQIIDPHTITIRTYERGVEDFTLSCGTGAVAAVCVCREHSGIQLPVYVRSFGGTLRVEPGNTPNSLWIWGTVEHIYTGIMNI
jgi:diaminopimelate epimerase